LKCSDDVDGVSSTDKDKDDEIRSVTDREDDTGSEIDGFDAGFDGCALSGWRTGLRVLTPIFGSKLSGRFERAPYPPRVCNDDSVNANTRNGRGSKHRRRHL
jgi:hypothetical protein